MISAPSRLPQPRIFGDSNRDGKVDQADVADRNRWSWQGPGAFLLANLDDDDGDGRADCLDQVVNGPEDEMDLARLKIQVDSRWLQPGHQLQVASSSERVRLFQRHGSDWLPIEGPLQDPTPEMELAIEATSFADARWDGQVQLTLQVLDETGKELAQDQARMRVAPFVLLPNTAETQEVYASTGHPNYPNSTFLEQLQAITQERGAKLTVHQTQSWKEMWMQDTMEVGYTQLPGGRAQHVVLGGLRQADSFGPRLLGPDRGFLQVGEPRQIEDGIDNWADWMGNLEVSPPVPGYPLGRVFYGRNTDTGVTLHPEVVAFLEAQQVQDPFWIDTGFLTIKHVDEIVNFVPGPNGEPRLLLADTRSAQKLVAQLDPTEQARVQERIDKILEGGAYADGTSTPGLLQQLNLRSDQVVHLPVGYQEGHNLWSNPINSIYLNGTVVTGQHRLPPGLAGEIEQRLLEAGAEEVRFVDDERYQENYGNVHCATNTLRQPLWADLSQPLSDYSSTGLAFQMGTNERAASREQSKIRA